ncbi:MAG: thioredoxin family protein [Denitrobacterium sp.]|jgi:small redox-active disulfide protein 2|nr:thioredoxin family protein [Denitrobacterium sp.]
MARVQVMGSGCKKCRQLYENAVKALGEGSVEYVTDMARIADAGVMATPALVVDGRPVSAGRVLKPSEISALVYG